ncbi:MAG TPA: protein translocase subunit SecF [Desulfovibrio sp.]|jgi:preprotein translocase subunit SecF|uniref:protein translocase subunit SecF n=1 Tax=Desulfovibrio TaxID=872 RepID=UPI002C6F7E97|nr:protein translocase subunit SecF [Desulfovibrio sp.]HMM38120.1 protein translocase subunit SecF [Desulfovibrio sp.]
MGLQFIRPNTKIDFVGFRYVAYCVSAALILLGLVSLVIKGGPRYGIDFAGGIIVQVKFEEKTDMNQVRGALEGLKLPGMVIQQMGAAEESEYLVRTSSSEVSSEEVRSMIGQSLAKDLPQAKGEIRRLEMVGPKVGADLRSKALEAMYYAILLIAIYISGRFEQRWTAAGIMAAGLFVGISALQFLGLSTSWLIVGAMVITLGLCLYLNLTYALGAVLALIHDVIITVGAFSLMNKEFDLTVIAALLTIIGYSLNDTIIVFDRIRETLRYGKGGTFAEVINTSINQTLSRTILTSGLTLIVVVCLYLLGGAVIHDFALALLIGIFVGTYSSIFVASPILLHFGKRRMAQDSAPAKA